MKYTLLQLQDCSYKTLLEMAKSMHLPRNLKKEDLAKLIHTKSCGTEVDVKRIYTEILKQRKAKRRMRKVLDTDRVLRVKSSDTNKKTSAIQVQGMSSEKDNEQGNKEANTNMESLSQNSNQSDMQHPAFPREPVKDFASACSILKSLPVVTEENFEVKTIPMQNIHGETMHVKALALKVKPSQEDEFNNPIVESLPSNTTVTNTTVVHDNKQNVETVIDNGQIDDSHQIDKNEYVEPIDNVVLDTQCKETLYLYEEVIELPDATLSTDQSELMLENNSCLNGFPVNDMYMDDIIVTPPLENNMEILNSNENFPELPIDSNVKGELFQQTRNTGSDIYDFYAFESGGFEQMCTINSNTDDFSSLESKILEESAINTGLDTPPASHESDDLISGRIAEIYNDLIESSKEYDVGIVSVSQNEIHLPETSDYNSQILQEIDIGMNLTYEDISSILE